MAYYTRSLRPWMLVLLLNVLYLAVIFAANGADPKVFVTLGECFARCDRTTGEDCPAGTEGYDGQFVYYIARDPAGSVDCLDVPAYRMQRILLPMLARVLALGRAVWIPWALVLINLAALVGSTALLEDLLRGAGASPWFALSYGLYIGVFMAVRLSTTEPLAYGLVIAAVALARRDRLNAAALLLALAGLAKEMTGLFAAGLLLYLVLQRRWRDALRAALIAGVPVVVWQILLYGWLGKFGIGSGGALASSFEIIPFRGVWRIIGAQEATPATRAGVLLLIIPSAVLPGLWALWQSLRSLRAGHWTLYACLLLPNAALMPFVPFSTYREFLGLLRFIPGLVLMILLYAAQERLRRPLLYSTLWIVLLLFLVSG